MGTYYNQILTILTTPPGNLTYHLVLAFAAAGALQGALSSWRQTEFPQGRRMVIGLSLLVGVRVLLFLGAGLVWQGLTPAQALLPILDRAVTMLGIVLIVWLWCFPEPLQTADAASLLLGFTTAVMAVFSYVWGTAETTPLPYNQTWLNIVWEVAALFILLLGGILAVLRRPNDWEYGLVMVGVMAGGHLLHLALPAPEGDFPGLVRLAQMAAYPLLFTLPQRFTPAPASTTSPAPAKKTRLIHKRRQYNVEPHILEGIFKISPELSQEDLQLAITRLSSQIMLADLSLLISPPDSRGKIDVLCGYDLIREESLGGISITSSEIPLLSTAIRRGQSLRLPASSTSQDFLNLSRLLRLGRIGHLLAAPLTLIDSDKTLGLILLSPYSKRSWSKDDQDYINKLTQAIQKALSKDTQTPKLRQQLTHTQKILESAQKELEETEAYSEALRTKVDNLEKQNETVQDSAQKIEKLKKALEKAHQTIADLEVAKTELKAKLEERSELEPQESNQQLENELNLTLAEIARLKNALAKADQKLEEATKKSTESGTLSEAQVQSVSALSQELRQPLSSMVGYTDILLGESVGILSTLQKQFLERIRASTERISVLLNTVIDEAAIDIEALSLTPSAVNLSQAIDQTITDISKQIRKKRISMRVDLPDKKLKLLVNQDSLRQILLNLLRNAATVTPAEGQVLIRSMTYDQLSDQDFALIQVADQGGGIPDNELPRVFSQLYKDGATIEGVGAKGVELSIVKSLVEAQQGRIWVDNQEGQGATFSLLLPLATEETDGV